MEEKIRGLIVKHRQLLLYGIIGGGSASLDLVVFLVLYNLSGLNPLLATTISTTLGITTSFFGNILFNFKVRDKLHHRYVIFYSVGMLGLLLSILIIYLLHDLGGLSANISKVISIPVVVLSQYILNSRFSLAKDFDLKKLLKSAKAK